MTTNDVAPDINGMIREALAGGISEAVDVLVMPPDPAAVKEQRKAEPASIWREVDSATEINRILNDPAVFPFIRIPDQQPFDLSRHVVDPAFVFLRAVGGVMIFVPDAEPGSGMYEVHYNFLEGYRGAYALKAIRAGFDWMFAHTPVVMLWGRIPANNRAALIMAHAVHAQTWFERKCAWLTDGGAEDLRFYLLSIHDWMCRSAALPKKGRWFNGRLEEEYARVGVPHYPQDDDPARDRMLGVAVEMFCGGQPVKGVILYNRWARAAGYGMLGLVSEIPLVVDIGRALLHFRNNNFKIIKVKDA